MEYVLVEIPDEASECIWVSQANSTTNRQTRVRENGTRNGDDCTLVTVTRDYVLETGGGDTVVLDGGTVFEFPAINEAGMLYITGFSLIMVPALLAYLGKVVVQSVGLIGRSD